MLRTPQFWQSKGLLSTLLLPFSKIYGLISTIDLVQKEKKARKLPKPVIVVGNINMGGTGKTPATIALTQALQAKGLIVGILSRGFGRQETALTIVHKNATPTQIGDEPYLIFQKTAAPMAVFSDRYEAGIALLHANPNIDCFICDDALQHRQLYRDIEIVVVGKQGFGNERLFPAGPLREPIDRLKKSDYILSNNANTDYLKNIAQKNEIIDLKSVLSTPYNIHSLEEKSFTEFQKITFTAVAGIAHPENFYNMLKQKGLQFSVCSFPDHFHFSEADLITLQSPILMTEKDAAKCLDFNREDLWAVPLENKICSSFIDTLFKRINSLK